MDEQTRKAFEDRPAPPKLPDKDKPAAKPRRPTGRQAVPDHLEAERHTVTPKQCACCGSDDLKVVDEVVETKLHVVKEHQRRRVVVRKTGQCGNCGDRTTARSLPAPFARSKATCEWLAWLVHQKFVMLGIVATCRTLGVDPLAYLAWAFTRLGTHRDFFGLGAAELTPAAYARANQAD